MLNCRGAPRPARARTEETPLRRVCTYSLAHLYSRSSLLAALPGRWLADSPGEFLLFGGNAKRFRDFHARLQLNDAWLCVPSLRVGLRIINRQVELDRCVIDPTVTLDCAHLIAMRLALRSKPGLFIKADCFDNERISVPFTDRISVPSRIRIVRELTSVYPDFADRVLTFEKHQNPSGNMDDFKGPNDEQNTRETHRIAFQDRIVPTRRGFGAVPWFVRVVLRLAPPRQWREVVARSLTTSTRCKLPYSGQVMSVERGLRLRSLRHS